MKLVSYGGEQVSSSSTRHEEIMTVLYNAAEEMRSNALRVRALITCQKYIKIQHQHKVDDISESSIHNILNTNYGSYGGEGRKNN
jgi:hypothetical protein